MIPKFDKRGYLPAGKPHKATWDEFCSRFGYNDHRIRLLAGLRSALLNLKESGCRKVFVDGSFVTNNPKPKDWDACWNLDGVDVNKLDRLIVDEEFHHEKRKAKYLGDLFLIAPRLPGRNWISYFQTDRDGTKKGIILIDMETVS